MGDTSRSNHRKKRKRSDSDKKFLVGESVEVRSFEDGFLGSWHPGKVISCKTGRRVVKYDHLLCDETDEIYTESIKVPGVIDGITNELESVDRCRIRPAPPDRELVVGNLHYGLCVDSYLNEAWWEGVVFDHDDGSDCREIFFPDLGDKEKVMLENIRITSDWDEVTEEWAPRGNWLFLEILEKYEHENMIHVSTRQIWYDMRVRKEFDELGDWWFTENGPLWEQLIVKVIDEYLRLSVEQFLLAYDFSEGKIIPEANSAFSHGVVALIDNNLEDDDLMTENDSAQLMALSIVPSSTNFSPVVEPKLSRNSKTDRKSRRSMNKIKWMPLNLEPKFCPESVDDYFYSKKPTSDLVKKIRQHVLCLGWTLESVMYRKKQFRVRYFSPAGSTYYLARDVVLFLKSVGDNSSEMAEVGRRVMVTSPSSPNSGGETYCHAALPDKSEYSVVPSMERNREEDGECYDLSIAFKCCPEPVSKYLKSFKSGRANSIPNGLANKARMHLSAFGWESWSIRTKKGRIHWRYKSPTSGNIYYSLRTACQAIKNGSEIITRHSSSSNGKEDVPCSEGHEGPLGGPQFFSRKSHIFREHRKRKRKQNDGYTCSLSSRFKHESGDLEVADNRVTNGLSNERRLLISFSSKKRKVLDKVKSCPDGHNSTRVLRSSKRVRQTGPSSSSQLPRTVLSWLIENNAVVPRSKVFYCKENSRDSLCDGRIASAGISCNCCEKLFTLSGFQAHATGNNSRLPAENIFLENGKSLLSCQAELMCQKIRSFSREPVERAKGTRTDSWNDHICSICHYGGDLILCDQCPSSYHGKCLNLEDVPEGDWFCPSCCCGVCGKSQFDLNTEQFTDDSVLCCHQCERQYHVRCKKDRDVNPGENWFCCRTCEKMHWGLQQLLGKPILVGHDNLTWTLIKPMQYQADDHEDCDLGALAENYSKISVALEVMHECFEPVKEPRTKRDLVEDVVFCRGSNLNRLNFKGFYTVLLERKEELITVALLRVYGDKVAEIPLIGTRFQHRRLGMCRILMNEVEKNLMSLGVQKLVLPAAASVLNTWINSFGFSPITESDRPEFLGYTFLDFQDTIMCQKLLRKKLPPLPHLSRVMPGVHHQPRRTIEGSNSIIDREGNSSMSEVFQEDQREGSETVDQGAQINGPENKHDDTNNNPEAPSTTVTAAVPSNQEAEQPCNNPSDQHVRKRIERPKSDGNLQCYQRKKSVEPRPPVPQTSHSNVEVSCR